MRDATGDELLAFWHKLMAEEAELIYELRQENQILQTIMKGTLALAVNDDSSAQDNTSTQTDSDDPDSNLELKKIVS